MAAAASTAPARPGRSSSDREVAVGRDQVARVMRQHGLAGKLRGCKMRTTIPDEAAVDAARDLLQRDFSATRPNEKWVADTPTCAPGTASATSPSSSTATAA